MKLHPEDIGLALGLLFVAAIGIASAVHVHVSGRCLSAGYPDSQISFLLTGYCIKRVNQTDVVVPLSEVKP